MPTRPIRRALIAVYDKTGIIEFARALVDEFGVEIISTGGTAKHLKDAGIPVTMVETVTGFPEMLDGRVKTLHPHIHAGILADRDNPEHMRQLAEHGIQPIDMVVVNLYPFEKTIADPNCKFEDAIEMIDIGGPCLLRAAAKNHRHVMLLHDRRWYASTLDFLRGPQNHNVQARRQWIAEQAAAVFWRVSKYDATVSSWLGSRPELGDYVFERRALHLEDLGEELRYGENPIQNAQVLGFGDEPSRLSRVPPSAGNQQLSYNNFVDADAALGLCAELTRARLDTRKPTETGSAKLRFAPGMSKLRFDKPESRSASNTRGIVDEVFTRRKLPHWQRQGAIFWVTFTSAVGELSNDERDIVLNSIRHWDGTRIDLIAAVVMPDHAHLLLEPLPLKDGPGTDDLSAILQSIKAFTGREISQGRGGDKQVWVRESFDRWIRSDDDLLEKYRYIANNPVKEGLAESPEKYRWWYGKDVLGIGLGVPVAPGPEQKIGEKSRLRQAIENSAVASQENEADLRNPLNNKAELCSPRACVFIKHTNACGVGIGADGAEAYRTAYMGDPNAAMGGVLAVNFDVTKDFAEVVMETYDRFGKAAGAGGFFVEVWVAPSFDDEAVGVIRTRKKWGANVRLLAVGDMASEPDPKALEYKTIAGGMLVQTPDLLGLNEEQWKVVTKRAPTESEMQDLRLAWLVAKHTKSNAISICKDGMLIGNGAGQMSRVMSCRIATWLAKENGHAEKLAGSVAASDAFFPFRDGPDILMDAGVTALIQPGGSKRDEETIAACDERGVAMIFTGTRHFKH